MAEEESYVVGLLDDFYRDSFGKIIFVFISIFIAIIFILAVSLYIHLKKPKPITFPVREEWRVQGNMPLDQPYLTTPDLLQWVSETLPKVINLDFMRYNQQMKNSQQFFTENGWQVLLNQLNIYANYNNVQANRLFVTSAPTSAPFIFSQGLFSGKYAWWVQMPIIINFAGYKPPIPVNLTLQILVVRVSTLNNLSGVAIDNINVVQGKRPTGLL